MFNVLMSIGYAILKTDINRHSNPFYNLFKQFFKDLKLVGVN